MKRLSLAAALLATTALASCSGGSDAPPPPPNETEAPVVIDETPVENVEVTPTPTPTPTPSPTPVAQDLSKDEQVQEDADAVGMTARLPRSEGEETPQPVE